MMRNHIVPTESSEICIFMLDLPSWIWCYFLHQPSLGNWMKRSEYDEPWPIGWVSWSIQCTKKKGCLFNFPSGHIPGLWFYSPVKHGSWMGGNQLMFLSLHFPFSKINKHILGSGFVVGGVISHIQPIKKNCQGLFQVIRCFELFWTWNQNVT